MKIAFIIILAIAAAVMLLFFALGMVSWSGEPPGLVDGGLAKCPDKPNCVCSEYGEDRAHYTDPLQFPPGGQADALPLLKSLIEEMGGTVLAARDDYLAATFSSAIFRFVDDLEVRVDGARRQIHIRSASRVGYGDGGVNKRRVERLGKLYAARLSAR
ncbi:DUF1499 domain-containing protein [Sedimenticola hydrogenitrophicus]|uniref:DUF1499 domain-containing protein n=1 Tax=Sedimenticola hydrogenitrophicus TaxID=2967975 RepID=UPI0021A3E756|nr:DUF1499 domain-containing protein [Sedimenticola hydrogenitrophicus]